MGIRRIVSGISGLALVGSLLVAVASPAPAAAAPAPKADCADTKADAAAAAKAAEACGRRVEILADRTESSQTFANPDGTATLEQAVQPVRVRKGGGWVPIDTTLAKSADGSIAPRATSVPVRFSAGGKAPLARILDGDRELAMSWPDPLPQPQLSGDTAVYREVLPGVDLRVTASATGFSEVLVVRSRKAASHARLKTVRFGLTTKGVSAKSIASGGAEARDASGRPVFVSPTPLMWDSSASATEGSGKPDEAPGRVARSSEMPAQVGAGQLSVVPDQALLADPRTKYPVYIDPSWTGGIAGSAWTSVWSKSPNSSFWQNAKALTDGDIVGSAGVGRTRDCTSCSHHKIRSFFRMNISGVKGKQILSAQFRIKQMWSWTCNPASSARVWLTGAISQGTTWNKQPSWDNAYTATAPGNHKVNKAHGCLGAGDVAFDVKSIVTRGAGGGWNDVTLGMRAIDEGTLNHWKRYNHTTPKLSINYNTIPNAPADRRSDNLECKTGAARPYVLTNTPVLTARQSDADGGQQSLTTRFYWWPLGGARSESNKLSKTSGNPSPISVTIPAGRLADNTVYVWQAITNDTIKDGQWSGTCEFTTDFTVPDPPADVASTDYPPDSPTQAPRGGVGVQGTFRITPPANRSSDVVAYAYQLDPAPDGNPAGKPTVAASTTDFTASITIAPAYDGTNILRVWTKERSTRFSNSYRDYRFKVRPGTGPAAEWTFNETTGAANDVTGHQNTATLAGGATRTAGRSGVPSALSLSGSAYAATAGQIVTKHPDTQAPLPVTSSGSLTVTAWVRLAATGGGIQHVVSYDGTNVHAIRLAYNGPANRWILRAAPTDTPTGSGSTLTSTSAPVANKWIHLAGVWNATNGQFQLYVNGTLESSTTLAPAWAPHGSANVFSIGRTRANATWTDYWNGALDDVRVYNFAVPAADIGLLVAPLPPKVTFPNGANPIVGQPFKVRFDAGGDTNVTEYRYSVGTASLGSSKLATPAGAAAEVDVTPTAAGPTTVYVKAVGAGGRQSLVGTGGFTGTGTATLFGVVVDPELFMPIDGALVTLSPGGRSFTTGSDGGYTFDLLAPGQYTVTASVGGRCGMSQQKTVTISEDWGEDLTVAPFKDTAGHTCRVEAAPFTPADQTVLPLTGDNAVTTVQLPFAFPFYGADYRSAWVDTNGILSFVDPGGSRPYGNQTLPTATEPNAFVAPFWDDLVVDGSASVRTSTTGTGVDARFVIEWRNVHRKASTAQRLTFEAILAPDGTIRFNHTGMDNDAERGSGAAVGIEDAVGEDALSYSNRAASLLSGQSIVIEHPDGASVERFDLSGTVTDTATGSPVANATVTVDPAGLTATTNAQGQYQFDDLVADSYTVTSSVGQRCVRTASAQVDLVEAAAVNLGLKAVGDEFGYTCATGPSTFIPAANVLSIPSSPGGASISLPFPVRLYGQAYTTAWVAAAGFVSFDDPQPNWGMYENGPVPHEDEPDATVYPFWDDLWVDDQASVRTQVFGTAPNRHFVVEWRNVGVTSATDRITVEVVLYEDGRIAFNYTGLDNAAEQGASATVGIENSDGTIGSQFSHNEATLASGTGILYTPPSPAKISGTVTRVGSGEVVSGTQVRLLPDGLTTTTAADGSYEFTGVPAGNHTVVAGSADGACGGTEASAVVPTRGVDSTVDLSIDSASDEFGNTCFAGPATFEPAPDVLALTGDDAVTTVPLPFPVSLYGGSYTTAWVDTNGVVSFEEPDGPAHDVFPIPSEAAPNQPNAAVYAFWEDWVVDAEASVRTGLLGSGSSRRFVIEWRNVLSWEDNESRVSFQVVFHEGGDIAVAWNDIGSVPLEQGATGIVGIENADGDDALVYSALVPLLRSGRGVTFESGANHSGDVAGVVRCGGNPVSGAQVSVAGQTATTGADGRYSFVDLPVRAYTVIATFTGTCAGSATAPVTVTRNSTATADITATEPAGYALTAGPRAFEAASDVLALTGDDAVTQVTLPFPVSLYGQSYTTAWVDTNGVVSFQEPDGSAHETYPIPSAAAPNQPNAAVYAFWEDWVVDEDASVRTALLGSGSSRKFVVEWRNVRAYEDGTARVTFQVVFHEGGDIAVAWTDIGARDLEQGATAVVGIENASGTDALTYLSSHPVIRFGDGLLFHPVS